MNNRRQLDTRTPLAFKVWFAFCTAIGLGLIGFAVWAVYALVTWVISR